jgi:hypothetical protein
MSLVAGPDVDFVAFHYPLESATGGPCTDLSAKSHRHGLCNIGVEIQLRGDLVIGHVEAHEIQHNNPGGDGMMLPCQNGPRKVIEAKLTVIAFVFLAKGVRIPVPVLFDTI